MYKSLIKALAVIVATTEAIELTSETQGNEKTTYQKARELGYLLEGDKL